MVEGSSPKITYENQTQFTFNIHYHGLNTVGSVDGTAEEVVFGHSTLLGPKVTFQFPTITNNQTLLWFHAHNMFVSMELIYAGIVGLLDIVDERTRWLNERFEYGDNQILLTAIDMDLTSTGTQTSANLPVDENRSSFAVINGTSAVNWYSSSQSTAFVNPLYHKSSRNLVKIDILNASLNWRVFHLGVCDGDRNIKSFYLVQTDSGLLNPTKLKMTFIAPASRVGILIDLNRFKGGIAHLFFYNYDLTEVLNGVPTFPDQPNNPSVTGTYPQLEHQPNPTPYPTPIPDPNQQNQQANFTNLDYPPLQIVPQTNQRLDNGTIKVPKHSGIKPFLKIILKERCNHNKLSLLHTVSQIRKTIFGRENYNEWKHILNRPSFEYDPRFNYLSFLNSKYYYNLPKLDTSVPTRNLFLFSEDNTNAIAGGNPNGTTEYVDGANRIMADLWNSDQLNLQWAMQQYNASPNNYKPPTLPTSKFRIYKTNDEFSNTAMISNDTLKIQFFSSEIAYGDLSQQPLASVTVVFPPTKPCCLLNLQEWVNLVNETFQKTSLTINGSLVNLASILSFDWSFFPYALDFLYQKTVYIKSAVVKTANASNYWIRFLGRWPLLQFFGKPMTGDTLDSNLMTNIRLKKAQRHALIKNRYREATGLDTKLDKTPIKYHKLSPVKNTSLYIKCDEVEIYDIFDNMIQQIFPFYATSDGGVQLPIACMKRDAELIIAPQQTYAGLYDGYLNDNLNSFSVSLRSSENWIYTNGDSSDAHPLHFHLTSGYASPQSTFNSPGLLTERRLYNPLVYPRDIFQIGPQEIVSFHLTWPDYSSCEKTKSPNIRCIGGVIHCHFLQHNDANSMIIQYFVEDKEREKNNLQLNSNEYLNTQPLLDFRPMESKEREERSKEDESTHCSACCCKK